MCCWERLARHKERTAHIWIYQEPLGQDFWFPYSVVMQCWPKFLQKLNQSEQWNVWRRAEWHMKVVECLVCFQAGNDGGHKRFQTPPKQNTHVLIKRLEARLLSWAGRTCRLQPCTTTVNHSSYTWTCSDLLCLVSLRIQEKLYSRSAWFCTSYKTHTHTHTHTESYTFTHTAFLAETQEKSEVTKNKEDAHQPRNRRLLLMRTLLPKDVCVCVCVCVCVVEGDTAILTSQ